MRIGVLGAATIAFALALYPFLAMAQETDIPLGKRLTAEIRSIIEKHKEMIREALAELIALKKTSHMENHPYGEAGHNKRIHKGK